MGFVWYVILMCLASIFYDRVGLWFLITFVFIYSYIEKKNKIKNSKRKMTDKEAEEFLYDWRNWVD